MGLYISTQKATISGIVIDNATGNVFEGVNVALFEAEEIINTDAERKYKLSTTYTGAGTLEFAFEGYATQIFTVDIPEGGTLTQDV